MPDLFGSLQPRLARIVDRPRKDVFRPPFVFSATGWAIHTANTASEPLATHLASAGAST